MVPEMSTVGNKFAISPYQFISTM